MHCPHKEGCEKKAGTLAAIRGLGITLVNFTCKKRLSELQSGQRVKLILREYGEMRDMGYGEADCDVEENEYTGVVMRPIRGIRILVWLDTPTRRGRNPIAVRPNGVTPIEGKCKVCPGCQQPEGTTKRKELYCPVCDGAEIVYHD